MSKKILSVALALIFVLSTFAVSAFAVGGTGYEAEDATYKQTWALEATDNGNGTWTVDVKLTATAPENETYAVGAIQFTVLNSNPAGAVLTSVEPGAALVEDYGADIQANLETGTVAIIPNPAEDATTGLDLSAGGVIATLTYTVSAGATLSIDGNDAKTKSNPGGGLIAVRMSDNTLTTGDMIYGQIVDTTAATAEVGSVSAPADLAKKAAAEAGIVIDTNKTFGGKYDGAVYGFSKGASVTVFRTVAFLTNAFEATNNGTLEIAKNVGGGYGTGATITVKNSDGTVAKVYVVVIFGDVDCNGTINVNDAALVKNAVNGSVTLAENSIERMAANCQPVNNATVMHNLVINDASYIKNYVGTSTAKFSPATLASYQYKFNNNYQ